MNSKLYVGNLPFETTEIELEDLFTEAGAVRETVLIQDKFTGKSRGFAFVTMQDDDGAKAAVDKFNGYSMNGRALVVNIARPREDRPAGGGGGGGGGYRGGGGGGGGERRGGGGGDDRRRDFRR